MRSLWIACVTGTLLFGAVLGYAGALLINRTNAASHPLSPTGSEFSLEEPHTPATADIFLLPISSEDTRDEQTFVIGDDLPLPRDIVVAVAGAVRRPGVYRFDERARVKDGILEAGGAAADADLDDINLAAKLMDNTNLYIPRQSIREQDRHTLVARRSISAAESNPPQYTRSGWIHGAPLRTQKFTEKDAEVSEQSLSGTSAEGGAINLNIASLEELQQLPGIGPKTAEKIIAHRQSQPFRSIDELADVHGIGPKKLEAVRALVTVE